MKIVTIVGDKISAVYRHDVLSVICFALGAGRGCVMDMHDDVL